MSNLVTLGEMSTEEALISQSDTGRCFARLAVSSAHDALIDFVNAEFARGTPSHSILHALARWMVQTHSSVAAQTLDAGGAEPAAELFKKHVQFEYAEHFHGAQAYLAQQREEA